MNKRVSKAIGCATAVICGVLAAAYFMWPAFRTAAQRREFGRGTQSIVEFFFRSDDLFLPVAATTESIVGLECRLDSPISFRYAGPYAVILQSPHRPPNYSPPLTEKIHVSISMESAKSGNEKLTFDDRVEIAWRGDVIPSYILHEFDVPVDLPLDTPLHATIVVTELPAGFATYYGPTAILAVSRLSSE